MVGFVHFSIFFIPSEKYYKLQSCWITLYLHGALKKFTMVIISQGQCKKFYRTGAKYFQGATFSRREIVNPIPVKVENSCYFHIFY